LDEDDEIRYALYSTNVDLEGMIEGDPSLLPDVSSVLGHSNIATTQKYYAQIRRGTALHRIENAWNGFQAAENKKNFIESEKSLSGSEMSGPNGNRPLKKPDGCKFTSLSQWDDFINVKFNLL